MIEKLRSGFKSIYTNKSYKSLLSELENYTGKHLPFRVAETPLFISGDFKERLTEAGEAIIRTLKDTDYLNVARHHIPEHMYVPGEDAMPLWLSFDFAVCKDLNNEFAPMMIEMQGFPSLYCYQHILAEAYRKHFSISTKLSHLDGFNELEYVQHLQNLILNNHPIENVVMMDIEPEKQNTYIDFVATYKLLGVKSICISEVDVDGKNLFYYQDGKRIEIKRIYNRVIFDELSERSDLHYKFDFKEHYNVEWAGHPNWFFLASKFTLPFIKSRYVPHTFLLSELNKLPDHLEHFVLKPLFSFSGKGVIFNVTEYDIDKINDKNKWILQRKVNYAPIFDNEGETVKAEIRLMYSWEPGNEFPKLLTNLVRFSKGEMTGVKYNKGKKWVGSSVGFWKA